MKSPITQQLASKNISGSNQTENSKKQKNYYDRFLQLLIRKTEAEKRAQIFGVDPFK